MVKCRACGKSIDKTTAFSPLKRFYYCSEDEYNWKKKVSGFVKEYIGETKNTILYAEMNLWGNDFEKIFGFMIDNRSRFDTAMRKDFVSEYAKIRYFSAIVKNGINDYKPLKPEIVKETSEEYFETKFKPRKKRKCLSDYIENEDAV